MDTAVDKKDLTRLLIGLLLVLAAAALIAKKASAAKEQLAEVKETLRDLHNRFISDDEFKALIKRAGYLYDPKQDIFYSHKHAWQKGFGYCRLYDEAAALIGMIIDCEPIYFEYNGKRWMIELWKGQYALATGCEVGVYATDRPDITIPGLFQGTLYQSVEDSQFLWMECCLKKNGKTLFTRKDKHWWLTGFSLGEFSEPWELSLDVKITLLDERMTEAFVTGLLKAGYHKEEIDRQGTTVSLHFIEPRTPQPVTRIPATDWVIQRKNQFLCSILRGIIEGEDNRAKKEYAGGGVESGIDLSGVLQQL